VLALLSACGGKPSDDPQARLRKLAVDPKELPASCHLKWSTRPFSMSEHKDGKLLALMAQFWFGKANPPKPEHVRAALSTVYSPPEHPNEGPLVLMAFDFKAEADAQVREAELQRTYKADTYRVHRQGSVVLVMAYVAPVEPSCALGMWDTTLARLAKE
jgi:hypothetical protein